MMYKDKDKQKEANRLASQRRRDKAKGMTDVLTNECYVIPVTVGMTVTDELSLLPVNFGQPDCECRHCQNNRAAGSRKVLNHGPYKTVGELADNELNRVSLPSDVDYLNLSSQITQDHGLI
jgi:hypothetical protein